MELSISICPSKSAFAVKTQKLDVFLWNYRFHLLEMTRFAKTLTKCLNARNGCICLKQSSDDRLHDISIGWKWNSQGHTSQNLEHGLFVYKHSMFLIQHLNQFLEYSTVNSIKLNTKRNWNFRWLFQMRSKNHDIYLLIYHSRLPREMIDWLLFVKSNLSFGSFSKFYKEVAC